MITIITGIPGMGKSALVVSMMMEEEARGDRAGVHRPVFAMGIPDLTLDHSPVPPVIEWTEKRPSPEDPSLMLDYFVFPPNSIIIIDEAQRVFRARSAASKVPDHVAALETHRHTGIDIWLLTQKPSLIDNNVRELCGRHIHIKPTILGRKLYEWPEYADVKSKNDLSIATKRRFKPPPKAFTHYRSSELHTKQKGRFHQVWILLIASILFTSFFGYKAYANIKNKIHPAEISAEQSPAAKVTRGPEENALQANNHAGSKIDISDPKAEKPQNVHPFMGYKFVIKGTMDTAKGGKVAYFDLIAPDGSTTFINSKDLQDLGYQIKIANYCSAFLFFQGAGIVATCTPIDSNGRDGAHTREGMAVASTLPATNS